MPDFPDFAPTSVKDLMKAIKSDLSDDFNDWWEQNKTAVSGAIRTVSQSAIETQKSLLKGHIDQDLADIAIQSQKAALEQVLRHSKLMELALLQSVVNTIFRRIGWALLNKTGINFFPDLIHQD